MTKARDLANASTALSAVTATELGYVDGVTSAIQTQLNAKQAVVSGVNDTEIGYLDGVTSAVQTQLDAKIAKSLTTTTGDIIYASSANTPARLGIGSSAQVLTVVSGVPSWATAGGGALKQTVFTSSNASWTIPSGVTQIWALVVGSGGGGGGCETGGNVGGGGGGAGQVLETWFTISGDTTLNITVPAGGAGGVGSGATGAKGSNGSAATIVGNTSSTTYASAAGGGAGAGSNSATNPNSGASGGGNGSNGSSTQGGGGGMGAPAANVDNFPFNIASLLAGGASPTTSTITGFFGGSNNRNYAGMGVNRFGRYLGGGGGGSSASIATSYGGGAFGDEATGGNGTANTGGGGGGTRGSSAFSGGTGGSGLVILRYVGA
jgi:hypothetical protein